MQANIRIQNAIINANAGHQAALVVDSANAHRAYRSFDPCVMRPVSKCPGGKRSSSSMQKTRTRSQTRLGLTQPELGQLTNGPVGNMWRLDNRHEQMPATLWATLILNQHLCG